MNGEHGISYESQPETEQRGNRVYRGPMCYLARSRQVRDSYTPSILQLFYYSSLI